MSQNKPPFEQAAENIRKFVESADMLQTLSDLQELLESSKKLSAKEQEGVHLIIDMAIQNLSKFMVKKGEQWN